MLPNEVPLGLLWDQIRTWSRVPGLLGALPSLPATGGAMAGGRPWPHRGDHRPPPPRVPVYDSSDFSF